MVVNAALYPPACPTRIRKSRLVIPIEKTPRTVGKQLKGSLLFRHPEGTSSSRITLRCALEQTKKWNFAQQASWPMG
jgi:hypothetical protein